MENCIMVDIKIIASLAEYIYKKLAPKGLRLKLRRYIYQLILIFMSKGFTKNNAYRELLFFIKKNRHVLIDNRNVWIAYSYIDIELISKVSTAKSITIYKSLISYDELIKFRERNILDLTDNSTIILCVNFTDSHSNVVKDILDVAKKRNLSDLILIAYGDISELNLEYLTCCFVEAKGSHVLCLRLS